MHSMSKKALRKMMAALLMAAMVCTSINSDGISISAKQVQAPEDVDETDYYFMDGDTGNIKGQPMVLESMDLDNDGIEEIHGVGYLKIYSEKGGYYNLGKANSGFDKTTEANQGGYEPCFGLPYQYNGEEWVALDFHGNGYPSEYISPGETAYFRYVTELSYVVGPEEEVDWTWGQYCQTISKYVEGGSDSFDLDILNDNMKKNLEIDEPVTESLISKPYYDEGTQSDKVYDDDKAIYCRFPGYDTISGEFEVILDSVTDDSSTVTIKQDDCDGNPVSNDFTSEDKAIKLLRRDFTICADKDVDVTFHVKKIEYIKSVEIIDESIPDSIRIGSNLTDPHGEYFFLFNSKVQIESYALNFKDTVALKVTELDGTENVYNLTTASACFEYDGPTYSLFLETPLAEVEDGKPIEFRLEFLGKSDTFTIPELKEDEWAGGTKEESTVEKIMGKQFADDSGISGAYCVGINTIFQNQYNNIEIRNIDYDNDGYLTCSELENVTDVDVQKYGVPYTDINWVSQLPNLKTLTIAYGPDLLDDVSDGLVASYTDLTPLANHPALKELNINNSFGGHSLDGLQTLTNLEILRTGVYIGNVNTNWQGVTANIPGVITKGLKPIEGLDKLKAFSVSAVGLTNEDLGVFADCTEMYSLEIYGDHQEITTLDSLAALEQLTTLYLANGKLQDVSALANMPKLRELQLYCNKIDDISSIANCTDLNMLQISFNDMKDLPDLTALTKLSSFNGETSMQYIAFDDLDVIKTKLPEQLVTPDDEGGIWFENQNYITRYVEDTVSVDEVGLAVKGDYPDSSYMLEAEKVDKDDASYKDVLDIVNDEDKSKELGFDKDDIKNVLDIDVLVQLDNKKVNIQLKGESELWLDKEEYGFDENAEYEVYVKEGDSLEKVDIIDLLDKDYLKFKAPHFSTYVLVEQGGTSATQVPATKAPTAAPTKAPTAAPTKAPTAAPTKAPTAAPTKAPTAAPTKAPTAAPTVAPTIAPTQVPIEAPTMAPTVAPTIAPTVVPTIAPTVVPPTAAPTIAPTAVPPTVAPPTIVPSTSTKDTLTKDSAAFKNKKVGITKLIGKKKMLEVKWKKIDGAAGYEIWYSKTAKLKKGVKKKISTKTSYVIKKLAAGKYYVKIRAFYYSDDDKKVYSSFSTIKNKKVKK